MCRLSSYTDAYIRGSPRLKYIACQLLRPDVLPLMRAYSNVEPLCLSGAQGGEVFHTLLELQCSLGCAGGPQSIVYTRIRHPRHCPEVYNKPSGSAPGTHSLLAPA